MWPCRVNRDGLNEERARFRAQGNGPVQVRVRGGALSHTTNRLEKSFEEKERFGLEVAKVVQVSTWHNGYRSTETVPSHRRQLVRGPSVVWHKHSVIPYRTIRERYEVRKVTFLTLLMPMPMPMLVRYKWYRRSKPGASPGSAAPDPIRQLSGRFVWTELKPQWRKGEFVWTSVGSSCSLFPSCRRPLFRLLPPPLPLLLHLRLLPFLPLCTAIRCSLAGGALGGQKNRLMRPPKTPTRAPTRGHAKQSKSPCACMSWRAALRPLASMLALQLPSPTSPNGSSKEPGTLEGKKK
jgi:hypothetical protein